MKIVLLLDDQRMIAGMPEPWFVAAIFDLMADTYLALPANTMSASYLSGHAINARWLQAKAAELRDKTEGSSTGR